MTESVSGPLVVNDVGKDPVRIALVLPELLGTYGDQGNALVLLQRLRWRGIAAELVSVGVTTPVPETCDIYLVGGGEDSAQIAAVERLRTHPGIQRAAERGAVIFAVCAGFQILGTTFTGIDGVVHGGLGMVDVTSRTMPKRATNELVVQPDPAWQLGTLTGFENHRGGTQLGAAASPFGTVISGVGNGYGRADGVVQSRILGTYLHGPALARNPQLADMLLSWATGRVFPPLEIAEVTALQQERLRASSSPVKKQSSGLVAPIREILGRR